MLSLSIVVDAIKEKKGCVFVHCHAGISRSATICIAYIMKIMQWNLSRAYEFVKERRPCISPNLHFMGQLLEFQKQLNLSEEEEAMEEQEVETDGSATPQSTLSDHVPRTGLYFDVSLHTYTMTDAEEIDQYSCSHSMALPSASAPSSLNFDADNSSHKLSTGTAGINSIQVLTEMHHRPALKSVLKPKSLPLLPKSPRLQKSVSVQAPSKRKMHKLPREGKISSSLPTTPTSDAQSHNHIQTLSPLFQLSRTAHPLSHSPCRVVAQLGSNSDSCLNYPLTESM
jgi:hypothetical protein